jgi:hypothetical protein
VVLVAGGRGASRVCPLFDACSARRRWRGNCDPALVPAMSFGRFRILGVALLLAYPAVTSLFAQAGGSVGSAVPLVRGDRTNAPVAWTGLINLAAVNGGVQKTGGCDGCPDASAVSIETIQGSGLLEWTAPEVQTLRMVGISDNPTMTNPGDIAFAIRLQAGIAEVRELGAYKAETPFSAGDAFRIVVEKGVVRYFKNGSAFYTSAVPPGPALRAHAVIFGSNGAISQVGIRSSAAGSAPSTFR